MDFIIKHMIKIRVLLIVIFLFLTLAIIEAEKILLYYVVIVISFTSINLFLLGLENKPKAKNMKVFKINMLLRLIHVSIFAVIGYVLVIQTKLFDTVWIGLGYITLVTITGMLIDKRDKDNTVSE